MNLRSVANPGPLIAAVEGVKDRTWPATVCQDPTDLALWNVRGIDGVVIFSPGLRDRTVARQACRGINEHFDHGRNA